MADKCHMCGDTSNENCVKCKRPTCKRHGRYVGDYFVCRKCADEYR